MKQQRPAQERLQDRVDLLRQVLYQEEASLGDALLHRVKVARLGEPDHAQVAAILAFDPLDALQKISNCYV